ncbi:hypothetical protein J4429_04805 [Candidatus Pacearchaeota archaeon]|nr:hypothetical protein [Candidatus Pacearchaeota archaeon]
MKSNLLTKVFGSAALLGALSVPASSQAGDGIHVLGLNIHTNTVIRQKIINFPVYKNVPVYAHTCQGLEFLGYQRRFEGYYPQVKTVVKEKLHVVREPCRPRPYTCTPKPATCAPQIYETPRLAPIPAPSQPNLQIH